MGLFLDFIKATIKYRKKGVRICFLSRIMPPSALEGHNKVGKFSIFKGELGRYSYIGDNSVILGKVGRYTSIANRVHVISGRHPLKPPFVSTHPAFYAIHSAVGNTYVEEQLFEEHIFVNNDNDLKGNYPSVIGNDCWIGEGASIIGGLTISDGAVVLANATVTKDVPPYAIVGGVPAQIIGYRYDEDTIKQLLEKQWWSRNESEIKEKASLLTRKQGLTFSHHLFS